MTDTDSTGEEEGLSPIRLLDELHDVVVRSRGMHAALTGCVELGSDHDVMEGVIAVFLDNMDALADFQRRLKTFFGHP
jgi:hypothetical protein